ncbi:SpoIIE family protein phosphatase [Microscilla marina]|uniref:Serine/threonine protein kinases n=1 Tax=Microscilla marina ATCC 23134 TaxID=313606 RepID=A1ZQF3_MICM2|nr:SpoIIE family protein phosphatase [Microscilla marina]EAY27325.1 serine/threonine protein kinases [Microscilla marina ATCC 23134]
MILTRYFGLKWYLTTLMLLVGVGLAAQTSWRKAKKTKQADITVYHINFAPFIYTKNQQVTGLEAELLRYFVKFVGKEYEVKTQLNFALQNSFGEVYSQVKNGPSGTFAASSFSVTSARRKEVQFSPIYMPDISIVISSNNLPILADTNDINASFDSLTVVQVPNSTDVKHIQRIAPYFSNLQYKNIEHFEDAPLMVSQNDNCIAYVQLTTYFTALQDNIKVKRQNLFQINKIGMAIVLPLKSDWDEPINAFFASPEFKPLVNRLIKKYFGDDVTDLIWQIARTESGNDKNVLLLTKEKELKELEIAKKQLEINRQVWQRNASVIAVLAILIIAFFIYSRYQLQQKSNQLLKQKGTELASKNEELRQQQEQILTQQHFIENKNTELERKNKEVAASIQTAQVIQNGILPHEQRLQALLSDYFVLYQPKDIVSGDFYWVAHRDNRVFLAVADCTGHGVPGALMSMVSYMMLDKLVMMEKLDNPADILNRCHVDLQKSLQGSNETNQQGMDIIFLTLTPLENGQVSIVFAGAKRPLYYISAGETHLQEIKGCRRSIGGFHRNNLLFIQHELVLDQESVIYLTTDGFVDQNNKDRKKVGTDTFKELLQSIAPKKLNAQKEDLQKFLQTHMTDTTQRDDILVMGVSL